MHTTSPKTRLTLGSLTIFAVAAALSTATASAATVVVSSYAYLAGPSQDYPDSGGELTDGIQHSVAWTVPSTNITYADVTALSGWQSSNPIIQFNFAAAIQVASVTVWAADSDGSAGVGLPSSIVIRTPDNLFSRTFPIANPAGNGSTVQLILSGFSVNTSSLIVEANRANQWTMLSEVEFSSIPEPTSSALWGLAVAGCLIRRKREFKAVI